MPHKAVDYIVLAAGLAPAWERQNKDSISWEQSGLSRGSHPGVTQGLLNAGGWAGFFRAQFQVHHLSPHWQPVLRFSRHKLSVLGFNTVDNFQYPYVTRPLGEHSPPKCSHCQTPLRVPAFHLGTRYRGSGLPMASTFWLTMAEWLANLRKRSILICQFFIMSTMKERERDRQR